MILLILLSNNYVFADFLEQLYFADFFITVFAHFFLSRQRRRCVPLKKCLGVKKITRAASMPSFCFFDVLIDFSV
jgi:hypothetical protein